MLPGPSVVETADKSSGQKYKQIFTENMSIKGAPKVRLCSSRLYMLSADAVVFPSQITEAKKGEEYTKISFRPDLARFGMETIDDDTYALLTKRVYDMAGTVRGVKVFLDGKRLAVNGFKKVRLRSILLHSLALTG